MGVPWIHDVWGQRKEYRVCTHPNVEEQKHFKMGLVRVSDSKMLRPAWTAGLNVSMWLAFWSLT